ncbi:MAG: c-type cytochrome [Verrucomicrobia bacterium]|nr:c-type cytochrome [Verrucomicrobiota bacterium]MDA1005423.1 c-type cytochrome [Verrucomicrobiota bacterium]
MIKRLSILFPTLLLSLSPGLHAQDQAPKDQKTITPADDLKKSGNITPTIVQLSPEEEAAILKDASVPEGFNMTLFAPWQTANYPVYVAASPEGALYVSSDGNGSLGRDPHRGRVLRLRDTNHDGRADQVTEFIKDIDSPRGLIWDHDRLYLLHPPHISVHFDRDHDGIAEESKILISDIAFGFKDRPADHTTNGLELGIDGWIYIAGGDFGFMNATGTDGRTLQHRGGGVIRFRPDGSGLELFATGTRNILGTPTSPTLDMFARDNTNDGGGWDVRLHHFTGLEDHGYPRLYINFADEIIKPLADYGGGSGCGSVYISEPGFPSEWNNAPFTCDWGRGATFHHTLQPKGATFGETAAPRPFINVNRPTDADVDGMSAVYQASWKGPATFGWAGPDHGYIVRVAPKGFQPEPLPDFEKLSDTQLVALLESPSHIRTLAAQRTLLRRPNNKETSNAILALATDPAKPLAARVAALYAFTQADPTGALPALTAAGKIDEQLLPYVLRATGDLPADALQGARELIARGATSATPRARLEACVAAARLNLTEDAPAIAKLLADPEPVVVHTAYRALAQLGAYEAVLPVLKNSDPDTRKAAARALMRMHKPEVIGALIAQLAQETDPALRRPLLSILCRLYHREGEWQGNSWGTRPDTRGPYYQPVTWEESDRILTALTASLATATPEEASFLIETLNQNRIQSNEALQRIIALATADKKIIPDALAQLAAAGTMPDEALPLILAAAKNKDTPPDALAAAIKLLMSSDHKEVIPAVLNALATLDGADGANKQRDAARKAFLGAPKLENHHLALEALALQHGDTAEGLWAYSGVLTLASRKGGSPESRQMSEKAIDTAWNDPARRIALIKTAERLRSPLLNDRIIVALNDTTPAVAEAAKQAANRLKIQIPGEDKTPKFSTLDPAKALAQVVKHKGVPALGESVFTRATCVACHTTSQDQDQKGPYLGNIATTYRRNELAEAILDPNKTIAQGFASNVITLKNGTTHMGFVTNEADDQVTLRDIAAQEHTVTKSDIKERTTLPTSMMPAGLMNGFTVHEMASLLDYLETLAKKTSP